MGCWLNWTSHKYSVWGWECLRIVQFINNSIMLKNSLANMGTYLDIFVLSCIRWVYLLHMSAYFHDMQTVCQRINTSNSFLNILLISSKPPAIFELIATRLLKNDPRLLPNRSLFCWSCSVKLLPCLRGWKLRPSFKDSLYCPCSFFSFYPSKNCSFKIHQADLAVPTQQTFLIL